MGRKIKVPNIKNVNVRFNGDAQGFDLFIKSLLSDYLHSGDVDKSPLTDVVDINTLLGRHTNVIIALSVDNNYINIIDLLTFIRINNGQFPKVTLFR